MDMINYLLFYLVILLSNIITGITGFAGTLLAMPPSLMLVGYPVAKPVLNVLGLLSGAYLFVKNWKYVDRKEACKIVLIMTAGIFCGMYIQGLFVGKEGLLYKSLGVFVLVVSAQGAWKLWKTPETGTQETEAKKSSSSPFLSLLLMGAGIIHGIFVSGGSLLTVYLTKRIHDKVCFRATISSVWIFLNALILVSDIRTGLWNRPLVVVQCITIPFLLAGMWIGSKLYARLSQRFFMMLTYVLLMISGISLLVK